MLTEAEIRSLSARNQELGWAAIPNGCPAKIQQKICEYRSAVLRGERRNKAVATTTPVSAPEINAEVTAIRELYETVRVF